MHSVGLPGELLTGRRYRCICLCFDIRIYCSHFTKSIHQQSSCTVISWVSFRDCTQLGCNSNYRSHFDLNATVDALACERYQDSASQPNQPRCLDSQVNVAVDALVTQYHQQSPATADPQSPMSIVTPVNFFLQTRR